MIVFILIGLFGLVLLTISLLLDDLLGNFLDLPFLSGTAVGGFCAAFGFAGLITSQTTDNLGVQIVAGVLAGLVIGGAGAGLTHYLSRGESGQTHSMSNIIGSTGVVTADITPGSYGQVSVTRGAHTNRYSARCDTPLTLGTQVKVTSSLSSTSVLVEPLNSTENP